MCMIISTTSITGGTKQQQVAIRMYKKFTCFLESTTSCSCDTINKEPFSLVRNRHLVEAAKNLKLKLAKKFPQPFQFNRTTP